MTTTTQSTGLSYGWWEKKNRDKLPKTVGHPRNYVLSLDELNQYHEVLQAMKLSIEAEAAEVRLQCFAMTHDRMPWAAASFSALPRLTTIADALEFMVKLGKHKLALMQCLKNISTRVIGAEAELRG